MVTFILPGFSPSNRQWVLEVAKYLSPPTGGESEIRPVFWDHWENPEKRLGPEKKAQDLVDILKKDYANIIAKSVGTLVAVLAIAKIPDQIEKVILCGIPSVSDKRLKIFQEALRNFPPERIIVFQNESDPLAPFAEVKEFMNKINPKIQVVEKSAIDHNYPYFEDFNMFLKV